MRQHTSLLTTMVAVAALAGSGLSAGGAATAAASGPGASDSRAVAVQRLAADATGDLALKRDGRGVYRFLGVPAGVHVDDPEVTRWTGVSTAAAAHLARYGAAFGSRQPGTSLVSTGTAPTAVGDTVRYQQRVDGVPVLGGQVVMSLREDRELSSVLARMSGSTTVARDCPRFG